MNRRGFLGGLLATLAAPAIIRTSGLLMPVRGLRQCLPPPLVVNYDLVYEPPSARLREICELLSRPNEILKDMVWVRSVLNAPVVVRVESTLAGVAWRRIAPAEWNAI
jgi:hypothetical protein